MVAWRAPAQHDDHMSTEFTEAKIRNSPVDIVDGVYQMAREHGWHFTTNNGHSWHKVGALTVVADIFSSLSYGPVSPYLLWRKHWQLADSPPYQ